MAKRQPAIVDDGDDGSISVDLTPKSRKFTGTDADPVDADTGEEIFADLTPRLRQVQFDEPEAEEDEVLDQEDEDQDEEESDEVEEDADQDEPVVADDDEDDEVEEGASRNKRQTKFDKRLQREKRLREEQAAENAELRRRLDKLESNQKTTVDENAFAAEKTRLDAKIVDTRAALRKAIEDGETEDQLRLTEELSDLKQELRAKEADHKRAKEAAAAAPKSDTIVVTKVKQWVRKHPRFNRDSEFAAFVKATDVAVAAAGFDPETDEFYAELDRRVKRAYPKEYPVARKKGTPPTANLRAEADTPSRKPRQEEFVRRGGKVTLNRRQVENMRKFQLDPTNPADVREYVLQNSK